ncbi:hypothetical protein LEP1GSC034_2007 [Leptospira interrogans str. 2003000735]|uniref:Uncharacterized protein n=6 Tax=Leptospira TaxID=171 RepID=A0A0E2B5A9_9LEPT|nr:hypothetical protein G436_0634 [Leptospira interrogans serovar Hardjo str. Norma]EJP05681.1 hypothetical protein LEP1GSC007_0129 [Leptospira interrogans serovar Bulgarica str. Mallika]EKN89657.1 hypothetical protein LEP1GSC027_4413 [Leptospira interrogans str. 2002000624]EKO16467.1 hypothetical protein LEP1GSC081_2888 [Leptospira kirschneri str. H1]EKO27530.1 hypothetical protein LEP1GSC104_3866 [Leptospira interrogans str. UI 12621]EKO71504.1 hypothetical protein LEP1GSC069_3194 [Leptospir
MLSLFQKLKIKYLVKCGSSHGLCSFDYEWLFYNGFYY